jgi:hypothetical protein
MAPIPHPAATQESATRKSATQTLSDYPVGVHSCLQLPQAQADVGQTRRELRLILVRLLASGASVLPATLQRMLALPRS